jgi:hypothetical protein
LSEFEDSSFVDAFRLALKEAGRLAATEKNLEDERKRMISGLIAGSTESVAKAEHAARSNRDVAALDDAIAQVRLESGAAAAEAKALETRYEIWRTRSASWRAKQGAK